MRYRTRYLWNARRGNALPNALLLANALPNAFGTATTSTVTSITVGNPGTWYVTCDMLAPTWWRFQPGRTVFTRTLHRFVGGLERSRRGTGRMGEGKVGWEKGRLAKARPRAKGVRKGRMRRQMTSLCWWTGEKQKGDWKGGRLAKARPRAKEVRKGRMRRWMISPTRRSMGYSGE